METKATTETCVNKNAKENSERLKSYADYYSEEQCGIILEMINVLQYGFFYRESSPFGLDNNLLARIGYKTYDTAKPVDYMNRLREMGVPNEMLEHTVYDYTEPNRHGTLSNYLARYWSYLSEKLQF